MTPEPPGPGRDKYYVANVSAKIVRERTQFIGGDGKLATNASKITPAKKSGRNTRWLTIS